MIKDVISVYKRNRKTNKLNNFFISEEKKVNNEFSLETTSQSHKNKILADVEIKVLQERMIEMRQILINDLNEKLNDMMIELMQKTHMTAATKCDFQKNTINNNRHARKDKLLEKQFIPRNSLLTDLFEISHMRSIYNIFIVMFFIIFLTITVHDFIETGSTSMGLKTIKLGFRKFSTAIVMWIFMTLSTFGIYFGFSFWAQKRSMLPYNSFSLEIFDFGFILLLIAYEIAFIIIPAKILVVENLGTASSLMILMEQVRMLMKTYAFVRSKVPQIMAPIIKDKVKRKIDCLKFFQFLYFLFAPTLIYKDEYPRSKTIRWRVVIWSFGEVIILIFFSAFVLEHFIVSQFKKFGLRIFQPQIVILTLFSTMLPGLMIYLFGFYCILHSWQNGMAEILRFADKLFYKDWWNCTTYDTYYRTWNIIVHDWLYTYIYKDIYEIIHSKFIAALTVILISAVFHEYILVFTFRFFYPVMLICFGGFGLILFFVTKNQSKIRGNFFMWFNLIFGNGIMFTLYSMEHYARLNCPAYENEIYDMLLPRSWICHKHI